MFQMTSIDVSAKVLKACTVMGGSGYSLVPGDLIDLRFGCEGLEVVKGNVQSVLIPYIELAKIDIGGPGAVVTGGGFWGGGFGVSGALEGMGIAMILNGLMSKTKIHTFISLTTHIGELHCHYGGMEPGAVRIELSDVFVALRWLDLSWMQSRLDVLSAQHAAKRLSDSEFDQLKERLLTKPKKADMSARRGKCPSCDEIIPLLSQECPKCKAMFGSGAAWSVLPV